MVGLEEVLVEMGDEGAWEVHCSGVEEEGCIDEVRALELWCHDREALLV